MPSMKVAMVPKNGPRKKMAETKAFSFFAHNFTP
jgi:hypothetical protein